MCADCAALIRILHPGTTACRIHPEISGLKKICCAALLQDQQGGSVNRQSEYSRDPALLLCLLPEWRRPARLSSGKEVVDGDDAFRGG